MRAWGRRTRENDERERDEEDWRGKRESSGEAGGQDLLCVRVGKW